MAPSLCHSRWTLGSIGDMENSTEHSLWSHHFSETQACPLHACHTVPASLDYPRDKNLICSSKCLSPSLFLLYKLTKLIYHQPHGASICWALCSGCMKTWCGLGLLGRKAMLYKQMDKTRPVSQRSWVCPCTGFQQVQLFIKDEVCQPETSAPSAGMVCAHQRVLT